MHMNLPFRRETILLLCVMILFAAVSSTAQVKFGVRAGATINPEQFHFGAHLITDPFIGNIQFRPNLELGVGNDVFTTAANFEFTYKVPFENKPFGLYIGIGPALVFYDTDTYGGLNVLFGLEHENGLMGEFKVGTLDSPDIKFTFGYTF